MKIDRDFDDMLAEYLQLNLGEINKSSKKQALSMYVSEKNYQTRKDFIGNKQTGVWLKKGDICFIDYGKAYQHEIGFQHFGLILAICREKILVVPMTSIKKKTRDSPYLIKFKKIDGMKSDTILFLTDVKYINSARVIDVKAHINENSEIFKNIKNAVIDIIMKN